MLFHWVTPSAMQHNWVTFVYFLSLTFPVNVHQVLFETWMFIHRNYLNGEEGIGGWFTEWSPDKYFDSNIPNLSRNPLKVIHILERIQQAQHAKRYRKEISDWLCRHQKKILGFYKLFRKYPTNLNIFTVYSSYNKQILHHLGPSAISSDLSPRNMFSPKTKTCHWKKDFRPWVSLRKILLSSWWQFQRKISLTVIKGERALW